MLFDEPTSALDPEMIKEVLDVMVDLAKRRHDDGRGHPRDGLRPHGRRPGRLHGRRRRSSRRTPPRSSSPTRSPTGPRTSSARSSSTDDPDPTRAHTGRPARRNHAIHQDQGRSPRSAWPCRAARGLRRRRQRRRAAASTSRSTRTPPRVRRRHADEGARRRGQDHVGVKFDQPGLGFKGATDDIPTGFDVEIAKILVADARHRPGATRSSGWRRSPTTASRSSRRARSTSSSRRTPSPTSAGRSSARPARTTSPASSCW